MSLIAIQPTMIYSNKLGIHSLSIAYRDIMVDYILYYSLCIGLWADILRQNLHNEGCIE